MGILHGVVPYQPPLANDRSIIAINFGLLLSSRSKLVASDFAGHSASSRTGNDWPRRGGEPRSSVQAGELAPLDYGGGSSGAAPQVALVWAQAATPSIRA